LVSRMTPNDRIFIAGHRGMVGSAIVRQLQSKGYTNLITRTRAELDLLNQSAVNAFFREEAIDVVFLAAAKVGGILANNIYRADFIYQNLTIQTNVIQAAYQAGVQRLLFLGSSCIYPRQCPQPMKEKHLLSGYLEPTNEPYAIAKIAGIKLCESYNRQYGTRYLAVMPTNLYGPNDNFDLQNSHVLPALIRKFHLAQLSSTANWEGIQKDEALHGPLPYDIRSSLKDSRNSPVVIWGTGKPRREFLHVDDMADACIHVMNLDEATARRALLKDPQPCFVNVGSGVDCTIKELVEIVRNVVGYSGEIVFDTSKPDGTQQKLLDVSRMTELGWRSSIDLTDGIKQTYQWYLNFRGRRQNFSIRSPEGKLRLK